MTSISSNPIALASYTAASKAATTAGTGNTASTTTNQQGSEKPADPVAEIKRLAQMMQARQTGGLFAAMARGSSQSSSLSGLAGLTGNTSSSGSTATIPLPDVGELDKDDAQKLLTQVQKLIDNGVIDGVSFKGSNGDKQTDSLTTYRDWLQAKVGIDTYA